MRVQYEMLFLQIAGRCPTAGASWQGVVWYWGGEHRSPAVEVRWWPSMGLYHPAVEEWAWEQDGAFQWAVGLGWVLGEPCRRLVRKALALAVIRPQGREGMLEAVRCWWEV